MGDLDGWRWACVLCGWPLLWLSPSYLFSTEGGPIPSAPLICGQDLISPPLVFPSRNRPSVVNCSIGNVTGDSLGFFPPIYLFFSHFNQLQSWCKEAVFLVSSLNRWWDLISRHGKVIIWSSRFLLTLSTLRMFIICCKTKQGRSMKGHCLFYCGDCLQSLLSVRYFDKRETENR